jgi:hypothetical protein
MHVNVPQLFYFAAIIFVFEVLKMMNSQPLLETVIKYSFFFSGLFTFHGIIHFFGFICLAFELTETIAWFFTHAGLNAQVLLAIDAAFIFTHHIELVYALIAITGIVIFFSFFPFFSTNSHLIGDQYFWFFCLLSVLLAYPLFRLLEANMDPFQDDRKMSSVIQKHYFQHLDHFFNAPINVSFRNPNKKLNLIILELESLERQLLGRYNAIYPQVMPYLSNLSTRGTLPTQIVSSTYTTWSVASLFACQCNLPLLMTSTGAYNFARFHLIKEHKCLGDYLSRAGYKLHSYLTNYFLGKFKDHMNLHGFKTLDVNDHKIKQDWDMFRFLSDSVLKNLSKKSEQPFVLHVANADTHPFPRYFVDPRCKKRLPRAPDLIRSFDCVDQILEDFLEKFRHSKLAKRTVVFMYGDHLLMSGTFRGVTLLEPRFMWAMLPFGPKQEITKKVSVYDFAPTLMDLLGIDYEPKFPFGTSMFAPKPGLVPDPTHFQFIYDHFSTSMKWNGSSQCVIGEGKFCRNT